MPLNPKIQVKSRKDVGGRYGLFAVESIKKGEWTWCEPGADELADEDATVMKLADIEALPPAAQKAYTHFMYKTGSDTFESLGEFKRIPVSDWHSVFDPSFQTTDLAMEMNHSCDPSTWFEFPKGLTEHADYMTARRDIAVGEEVTFDYSTCEDHKFHNFKCLCGSPQCRGQVSGEDWKKLSMQIKYAGHWAAHIARKIAQYCGEWQLERKENEALGRYLVTSMDIPAGQVVMVLPPNILRTGDELEDPNLAVQVGPDLFSYALSRDDTDVLLCHSCEPNTAAKIFPDYSVHIFSIKDIPTGTVITFDYDTTEDDMEKQGCAFDCSCGTPSCRGRIVGFGARARSRADQLELQQLQQRQAEAQAQLHPSEKSDQLKHLQYALFGAAATAGLFTLFSFAGGDNVPARDTNSPVNQ